MTKLVLDRMTIEDVGLNPRRLAEAIHVQLGDGEGPVPVREIATALDIDEIREHPLTNLEAALVTTPERNRGRIVLNSKSSHRRRRFSLGHEVLHFLNPTHEPTSVNGFECTYSDMRGASSNLDRHWRQEAEANRFAIELLIPSTRLRPFLVGDPDLHQVLAVVGEFDVSREASVRRYVECHPADLAVVFCKDGCVSYWAAGKAFPKLSLRSNQQCDVGERPPGTISDFDEVRKDDWLSAGAPCGLSAQTLWQAGGKSMTLLSAVQPDDEDDSGIDDALERFTR